MPHPAEETADTGHQGGGEQPGEDDVHRLEGERDSAGPVDRVAQSEENGPRRATSAYLRSRPSDMPTPSCSSRRD